MNPQEKKLFTALQEYDFITQQSKSMLKIELEIGLETIWNSIVLWSGVSIGFLFLVGGFSEQEVFDEIKWVLITSFILLIVGFFLRKSTDNYYVLDFNTKLIFYHKHFFRSKMVPLSKFKKIKAVAVDGVLYVSNYGRKHWEHHIILVLPNFRTVRITDPSVSTLESYNALGTQLSNLFQCPFYRGKKSNVFVNKGKDYSAVVLYKKQNLLYTYRFKIIILIILVWFLM